MSASTLKKTPVGRRLMTTADVSSGRLEKKKARMLCLVSAQPPSPLISKLSFSIEGNGPTQTDGKLFNPTQWKMDGVTIQVFVDRFVESCLPGEGKPRDARIKLHYCRRLYSVS